MPQPHALPLRAAVAAWLMALPLAAGAETLVIYGGAALEYSIEPNGPGSDNVADVESYIELESRGFYGGIWGQVSSDDTTNEIDLYLGYRRTLDSGVSYDVAYTRYIYPNDGGDCCGELSLSLGVPAGDAVYFTLDLAHDPEASLSNGYLSAEYYASDLLTLGTSWGVAQNDGAPDTQEWELTAGFALTEEVSLTAGWYDGNDYDGYVALTLSFDTTLLSR